MDKDSNNGSLEDIINECDRLLADLSVKLPITKSVPRKWHIFCDVLLIPFLGVVIGTIIFYGILGILTFPLIGISLWLWYFKKGYRKFTTSEEKEARKEARRIRYASTTIRSPHLMRLQSGLYTGLGNRRPGHAGRRTKKF